MTNSPSSWDSIGHKWWSWCIKWNQWISNFVLAEILYNFDQFVTPQALWLWHAWQKFLFITLPGSLWHGQNFIRYCPLSGHFDSVSCWIWGGGTQWKPKLVFCDWKPQILAKITLSRSLWQTTLSSSGLVTYDKDQISFHQVALWHVTDELYSSFKLWLEWVMLKGFEIRLVNCQCVICRIWRTMRNGINRLSFQSDPCRVLKDGCHWNIKCLWFTHKRELSL